MLRCGLIWIAFVVFASACKAQTGTVDGRVTNSVTGEPIAGATIHLVPLRRVAGGRASGILDTVSRGDGTYQFDEVSSGTYVVRAEHTGFTYLASATKTKFIEVAPGESAGDESILLTPNAVLRGTVLDDAGSPVPGAHLLAITQVTSGGQKSVQVRSTADSAATGAFTLNDLSPGNYFVQAQPPVPTPEQPPDKAADKPQKAVAQDAGELVRTFYPRAFQLEDATPVAVTAGQAVPDVTITLRRAFTHSIRGHIAAQTSEQGLHIVVVPQGLRNADALGMAATVSADGKFEADHLPQGSYTVELLGRRRSRLLSRENVEVGAGDVSGIILNSLTPITLEGTVSVEGEAAPVLSRVGIVVRYLAGAGESRVNVNADGSFVMSNLSSESAVLRASVGSTGLYVKSIRLNQQEIKDRAVDLSEMGRGKIEIVLGTGAGEIDGHVTDAGAGATVGIIAVPSPIAPDASNVVRRYSRNDGTFAIANLEPGDYRLYAVASMQWALWQTPEFLQAIQMLGTVVHVDENQHLAADLKEISAEAIEQTADQLGLTIE